MERHEISLRSKQVNLWMSLGSVTSKHSDRPTLQSRTETKLLSVFGDNVTTWQKNHKFYIGNLAM